MAPNGEWDVLGWQWGLGLPIEWFDVAHIQATLGDTEVSRIDQLLLGWEGTEIKAWEVIRKLLRSKGFFFGISSEGKIRFPRVRMANVSDIASPTTITPIPDTLRMEPSEGEGVERIVGYIGALPWDAGAQYEVNIIGDTATFEPPASYRAGVATGTDDVELDLSTWSDDGSPPLELAALARMRAWGSPILYVKANDGAYGHGDILKVGDPGLSDAWFIADADGQLLVPNSDPRWYGQVIGFRRNFGDGTIDLTLIMHNWHRNKAALLRAPAARCAATPGTNPLTLTANTFSSNTTSGAAGDAAFFRVGDKVELWRPDGVRRSGTSASPDIQEITAISADGTSVTLDAAFTTAAQEGDVLRYARVDGAVSGNDDNDSVLYTGYLPYACLADSAGTISPNNLDAHTYGFGTP